MHFHYLPFLEEKRLNTKEKKYVKTRILVQSLMLILTFLPFGDIDAARTASSAAEMLTGNRMLKSQPSQGSIFMSSPLLQTSSSTLFSWIIVSGCLLLPVLFCSPRLCLKFNAALTQGLLCFLLMIFKLQQSCKGFFYLISKTNGLNSDPVVRTSPPLSQKLESAREIEVKQHFSCYQRHFCLGLGVELSPQL